MAQPKHSIVRASDIRVGKVVYREWFGRIQKIQITSRIKNESTMSFMYHFDGLILGDGWMNSEKVFLGDAGTPGFKYDDRPSTLFTTKHAAVAAVGIYSKWLSASRFNNPILDEPYDHFDDRWDEFSVVLDRFDGLNV